MNELYEQEFEFIKLNEICDRIEPNNAIVTWITNKIMCRVFRTKNEAESWVWEQNPHEKIGMTLIILSVVKAHANANPIYRIPTKFDSEFGFDCKTIEKIKGE